MVLPNPSEGRLDHRTGVRYGGALPISPTPAQILFEPVQGVLGDAVPLGAVDFVVVDLETTGGSPIDDAITEIGAVRFHGVERVGSFGSLVDPERPIPRAITHLTGISDRLVAGAPTLPEILPTFLEFARGCVVVAHNAAGLSRAARPGGLHGEARAPPRVARRAERAPAHPVRLLPHADAADASRVG
jgi:hypothetical protein